MQVPRTYMCICTYEMVLGYERESERVISVVYLYCTTYAQTEIAVSNKTNDRDMYAGVLYMYINKAVQHTCTCACTYKCMCTCIFEH